MNKLLVAVCALACGANALYHFHLNLPDPCDLILNYTAVINSGGSMEAITRMHGTYQFANVKSYGSGVVVYKNEQLIRPDNAEPGKAAALYSSDPYQCQTIQMDESGTINQIVDLYFTNREDNVMFHGIQCTALYNLTEPSDKYMVNEDAGIIYGMKSADMELFLNLTTAKNNRREMFKFDKKEQPNCDSASYIPPTPDAYEAGCKKTALPNLLRMARQVRRH